MYKTVITFVEELPSMLVKSGKEYMNDTFDTARERHKFLCEMFMTLGCGTSVVTKTIGGNTVIPAIPEALVSEIYPDNRCRHCDKGRPAVTTLDGAPCCYECWFSEH